MNDRTDKPCRHCERPLADTARYCPGCGRSTRRAPAPIEPIGITLICLGVFCLVLARQDHDQE